MKQKETGTGGSANALGNSKSGSAISGSALLGKKPSLESIRKTPHLLDSDIRLMREQVMHDLKNQFSYVIGSVLDGKTSFFEKLSCPIEQGNPIPGFRDNYSRYLQNLEHMDEINSRSLDAFILIVEGNLDDAELRTRLKTYGSEGERILSQFYEHLPKAEIAYLSHIFTSYCKQQGSRVKLPTSYKSIAKLLTEGDVYQLENLLLNHNTQTPPPVLEALNAIQGIRLDLEEYLQPTSVFSSSSGTDSLNSIESISYFRSVVQSISPTRTEDSALVPLALTTLDGIRAIEPLWALIPDAQTNYSNFSNLSKRVNRIARVYSLKGRVDNPAGVILDSGKQLDVYSAQQLDILAECRLALPHDDPYRQVLLRIRSDIVEQRNRLENLLGATGSFAEGERYSLNMQPIRVALLAAQTMREAISKRGSITVIEWEGVLGNSTSKRANALVINSDSLLLQNAIFNVAFNADKYGRQRLVLGVYSNRSNVFIDIKDDGEGMTAEEAAHAFDRGVQNPNATASSTGFGLSSSRRFLELLGGQIEITDPGPRGGGQMTTFRITLPRSH